MSPNTIHVFRDGNGWLAKVGNAVDGILTAGDTPAKAALSLAVTLKTTWWPFDHTIAADALAGHANAAVVCRADNTSAARAAWHAKIGPDSTGCSIEASGVSPADAFFALVQRIYQSGWRFDPSWKPE